VISHRDYENQQHIDGGAMEPKPNIFQILLEAYSEYREAYISSKYFRLESY
jgi:hypothetical protein